MSAPTRRRPERAVVPAPLRRGVRPRPVVATAALLLCAAVAVTALCSGELVTGPSALGHVISGHATHLEWTVIRQWRLPRVLLGLGVGALLGLAGALSQAATRNPLATPDVLGVDAGAATGAVLVLVGGSGALAAVVPVPVAALLGATLATAAVAAGALRTGSDPTRVIVTGVAVNAGFGAITDYLLVTARSTEAVTAQTWLAGSLEAADWDRVRVVAPAVAVGTLAALASARSLAVLALDDTTCRALGVDPGRTRWWTLATAVVTTAVAVGAAGPVAFVAFAAPHLARGPAGTGFRPVASAATGAALVVTADLVARTVLPWALPVGLLTAALGAPVLVVAILRMSARQGR